MSHQFQIQTLNMSSTCPLLWDLLQLAGPSAVSFFLGFALQLVSIIFVGHLGEIELGAAGIGNMVANVTGYCIGMGLCMALDTLCSTAFGAGHYSLVGLHAQRAIAVLTVCTIPIAIVWANTERILIAVGLTEIASKAGHWTTILIIGLWPALVNDAMKRYLQCQGIIWPMIASSITVLPIHSGVSYLFVFHTSLGFTGAALAIALSNWLLLGTLVLFMRLRRWRLQSNQESGSHVQLTQTSSAQFASDNQSELDSEHLTDSNSASDSFAATLQNTRHNKFSLSYADSDEDVSDDEMLAMASGAADSVSPIASPTNSPRSQQMHFQLPSPSEHSVFSPDTKNNKRQRSRRVAYTVTSNTDDNLPARTESELDTWPELSWDIFRGWSEFLRLGVPAAASLFIEWGSYEVTAWAAGRISSTSLAAHTVFMQTVTVWYMMPVGLSVGTSTRIGNSLGAGKADDAATYAKLGFLTALLYALSNGCIFVLFLRRAWNSMFSEDAAVLQLLNSVFPVLFFYGVFDATKCVMMGVLRGAGRPSVTVWGNTLACILVGAPLSYLFAFHLQLGLQGLWIGMACAWLSATAVYAFVVFRQTDWPTEVVAAAQRNESSLQSRNLAGELP